VVRLSSSIHLYHLRSVTYGLSSLSSLRYPPPSCFTLCTPYSLPYSEFPFCSLSARRRAAPRRAVRTRTKLHPLSLLLVLLLRITGVYRQRAARLPNPIPPTHPAGSNLRRGLALSFRLTCQFLSLHPSAAQAAEPPSISFSLRTTVVNAGALVPLMHPSPRVTAPYGHRYSRFRRNPARRIAKKRAMT